jgi:putative transposase
MGQPIALRQDYDAARLRRMARESADADQVRRLLALAVIYEGGSRTEAAEVGGVTLQAVRDWVLRFNAYGPVGLIDRKAPGPPPRLNDEHRAALWRWSRTARSPPCMRWFAGGPSTCANGSGRNTRSPYRSRR